MDNTKKVIIFDTTLRDGAQTPGIEFSREDALKIVHQLACLGVDIAEAGFPFSSNKDFQIVRAVAAQVSGIRVCALARAVKSDIDIAAKALENALEPPRIHTFIGTSPEHMKYRHNKSPEEVLEMAVDAVQFARKYVDDVQFSAEDATRSNPDFLKQVFYEVIMAGATSINVPDTVGYAVGGKFGNTIRLIIEGEPIITERGIIVSVHCHNDLGFAVANSLAGLENGARQVECTIEGIGERAGNANLAATVMALKTREDYYGLNVSHIDTGQLGPTSILLSRITGRLISDNSPVTGRNAFAHDSGIHQDGVDKKSITYEIMSPQDVGWDGEKFPLSSHAGRAGLLKRLEGLDYKLSDTEKEIMYKKFIDFAEGKLQVHNPDLHMLMQEMYMELHVHEDDQIEIVKMFYTGSKDKSSANVSLKCNTKTFHGSADGNGAVNALANAIEDALTQSNLWPNGARLSKFKTKMKSGESGTEATGVSTLCITQGDKQGYGRGKSTDTVIAETEAIVAAIDHIRHFPVVGE